MAATAHGELDIEEAAESEGVGDFLGGGGGNNDFGGKPAVCRPEQDINTKNNTRKAYL